MSSDNDQIPKSGKRKKYVIPDSEDSDESVVNLRRRKKTFRVISEGESSDEDSDVLRPIVRRRNPRVDETENETSYEGSSSDDTSEWQSDWSSSTESEQQAPVKRKLLEKSKSKKLQIIVSDTDTDTSDDQVEKCPICLLPFRKQQLGTPSSCEHCFCLECLMEWSKNINTCPVDRQTFTAIHVRDALGGQITRHVPVDVTPRVEDEPLEDPTFCEVCHLSDREDRMLLCDGCDCGYHLECLIPPMNEVPMEEWFCPECSQNSQNDAEVVEIDLDEIPDLMEEARRLGVSYGRTRTGAPQNSQPRIVPRTRHTERVRATIRRRNRVYDSSQPTRQLALDPSQPSTSSGLESFGDNSRSLSPSNASNSLGSGDRNCLSGNSRKSRRPQRSGSRSSDTSDESVLTKTKRRINNSNNSVNSDNGKSKEGSKKSGSTSRKSTGNKKSRSNLRRSGSRNKSKKTRGSKKVSSRDTLLREVRITECNEDGEEEEIVTFVKVASVGSTRRRRRRKGRKRRKVRRQARTVSSVLASSKKRLAVSLGICKPIKGVPALIPSVKNRPVFSERSSLNVTRYNAGISRLSLLGDNLDLSYSPPGSDIEDYNGTGPTMTIHRRSAISSRRQLRLKNIVNPQPPQADLLSSIISNQEVWHSKNNNIILKANGLLLAEKKENTDNLKKKNVEEEKSSEVEETVSVVENRASGTNSPLEVSGINPELIIQAPMYNNPCGGGNRGNFRGGYRDNTRHSHGGQNYGRDSLPGSGRHSYGGSGSNFGRDFGPPAFYNPNFEHCGPPMFGGTPPFRNRNPQHFRNERFRFMPPGRPPFNFSEGFEHHSFPERFNRPRSPQAPIDRPQNNMPANLPEDTAGSQSTEQQPQDAENVSVRPEEDCDIYCDIETKSDGELQDQQNGSVALLPPPEPPSGLLDFEENSRSDKDSDQELVIDDSQKEDTPKNDKYDPFSVDSDSDSEVKKNEEVVKKTKEEKTVECVIQPEPSDTLARLSVYDDDDEEDSQADCPNFSIYSSQTMDVARHTEQQLSQQIGPLEPPPLPPSIPDDDDVIVGDVQACDLADIPEPSDPYVEALRKERQTLSKIPPKKISHDCRGKITFKIGTKLKINNRLLGLQEEEEKEDESEKKKEVEQVKEEETHIDRDEERKKIAKSKFEEEAQSEEDKEEVLEELSIFANPPNVKEKDTDGEQKEEESAAISTVEETEKISDIDVPPERIRLSPPKLENELSNECVSIPSSEEDSETSTPHPKIPTIEIIDDECPIESSKMQEEPNKVNIVTADVENNKKDEKEQRRGGEEDEEDEEDEEEEEEDEEGEEEEENEIENENGKEKFPIEKEPSDKEKETSDKEGGISDKETVVGEAGNRSNWESNDGAYTPCKDELPLKESRSSFEQLPPLESGLEPITPTKDKLDDLDSCRTPVDYNVLGTEAISETDEAMNFEDELTLLTLRKEKEMEDGEIVEEKTTKEAEKVEKEKEEDKKRKKKDKKERGKDTEKNKENIASENQVAWKKLSKSTKERSYRDKEKRSKSKEKDKQKKKKEVVKKKEKRKELPRYDVRKIVAERPSRPRKDEYGRDIREKSRQRSRSRSCSSKRSRSYSKLRSRSRSRIRLQRSWSRDRRSYSKSLSRRRSLSRGRRKSPKRRSTSRRRSSSRRRSRSVSRKRRSLSRKRSRRSVSRSKRSLSRSRQRRSLSRSRRSLSRSRDRRKDKKKYKSRSRSRNRKKSRSKSPKKSSKSRERKLSKRKAQSRSRSRVRSCSRNWEQIDKIVEQDFSRQREERERDSWSAQWTPSWSRSRSKSPQHVQQEQITSRDWSPVLDNVAVPPKNLTVILTNKEAIKKKKKERRKEGKKSKDDKKRKGKRNRTPPPSKEVFASGDNILVSVCFNKDNETIQAGVPELPETIPLIPPLKRRRREPIQAEPPKRSKKDKTKDKRSKSPKPKKDKKKKSKAAEIAATKKPVAVIDLDQSPFREQTPSPRDVIVLSDDDDKQVQQIALDQCQPSQNSPQREQFVSQGPKTPPEPQIKFSINKQTSNLRPSMLNPLLDEEEEEEMDERVEEELEMRAQEELELRLKIGPNTPPEPPTSPPTSPDAYDPFDPTKSRSPTPDASQEANSSDERRRSPRKHDSVDGIIEEENIQKQERQSQEKQLEKPKIISMVTIKRASPQRDDANENDNNKDTTASTGNMEAQQGQQNAQNQNNPFGVINPVLATVAAAVQRSGVFNASNTNSSQRTLLQSNRISPSNQQKQRSQAPAAFANSGKPLRGSKSGQTKSNGQNGNDPVTEIVDNVDMSSPYSPGSTLSDGMFDPPSPINFNSSPGTGAGGAGGPIGSQTTKTSSSKTAKSADKKDPFDALFNIMPSTKTSKQTRSKKADKDKKKKPTNPKVGVRMDENQLQILDDLPSSAVEMQVKDKFLKKLNRQERVVEEVKLVLKPHYTKKHVTKEEYKDIMRKAVPKICHNKTGEINPKKIAHLIEAYVRKCRNIKKKTSESSSAKASKPAKIMWS
ncbi:uncharacterized protein LOC128880293 [Hylaeus volcanicus]|uniref:uncharacterized protein LOC128880293 n=1 Tax=Hylaeus volcanicus TaxID=313075 RepID=UPI0023B82303|nr:uncharacterized protein LOC128880293 [Hylaeus volcanicus]